MRIYLPIAKVDAEQRMVWGYASTEARDDQGEIIKRPAIEAALGDYMKFANIREMHQLSAVGVAKEAAVDDKGLYVGAKVVDPLAWQKVIEGVYKGYSIGGRVTARDPGDRKTITGLVLNEISLVDRPANPESVFDYWKASGADNAAPEPIRKADGAWDCGDPDHNHRVKSAAVSCRAGAAEKRGMADIPFNAPIQIWACGVPEHRHIAKADAVKCAEQAAEATAQKAAAAAAADAITDPILTALSKAEDTVAAKGGDDTGNGDKPYGDVKYADPGYQADGKKRYPIDNEKHIRAAWNYINKPKNAGKYSSDHLASIKSRIVGAWKEKIDKDGPPSAEDDKEKAAGQSMVKALWDVGHVAHIILDLNWLKDALEVEAMMEGDSSPQPARLAGIVTELCGFLNALVAEETAEILSDGEVSPGAMEMAPMMLAAYAPFGKGVEFSLDQLIARANGGAKDPKNAAAEKARANADRYEKFKADLTAAMGKSAGAQNMQKAGAKHSAGDQAMLDLAYHACTKCAGMGGLTDSAKDHMTKAAECFKAAGAGGAAAAVDAGAMHSGVSDTEAGVSPGSGTSAVPMSHPPAPEYHGQNATADTRDNPASAAPQVDPSGSGSGSNIDQVKAAFFGGLDAIAKRNGGHQALMDVAHDCAAKVSDGMTCGAASKVGARHSAETMGYLAAAHSHLMAAGANCGKAANAIPGGQPTANGEQEAQGTKFDPPGGDNKAAGADDLRKALDGERAEKAALIAKLIDIVPRLDQLTKRVEEISAQPLPPKAAVNDAAAHDEALKAAGVHRVERGASASAKPALTPGEFADEFSKMSKEDQTLALIAAAQRNPMAVPGSGTRLP